VSDSNQRSTSCQNDSTCSYVPATGHTAGQRWWKTTGKRGKLNKEDAVDRSRWKKLIKDVRRSGRVRVGECFSWHRPSRVVPDKRRYTTRLNVAKLSLRNIRSSNLGPDSQNTLRQSYDYRTITPKLRLTSNLRNLLRRTQGFPWYDSLATSQDRSR